MLSGVLPIVKLAVSISSTYWGRVVDRTIGKKVLDTELPRISSARICVFYRRNLNATLAVTSSIEPGLQSGVRRSSGSWHAEFITLDALGQAVADVARHINNMHLNSSTDNGVYASVIYGVFSMSWPRAVLVTTTVSEQARLSKTLAGVRGNVTAYLHTVGQTQEGSTARPFL